MKIIVYKGFNKEFLENLENEALLENSVDDKMDIFKIDDNYEEEIQLSILRKRNSTNSY